MRFLLRPGWLAFIAGMLGFAVACYLLLAPWQFSRNEQRSAQNAAISAAVATPPVPLAEVVPAGTAPSATVQWRLATLSGRYLAESEAVVRLRTIDGKPAYEVLTPLRTVDGRTVVVNRGYIRPDNGNEVPRYAPPPDGEVSLTARIRLDESDPQGRGPFTADGHRQLYAADSRALAAATGLASDGGYLQLAEGQPGGLGPLPLPESGAGPFLSYAWQWLTFGAFAIFGLVYFARLELLQRRDQRSARSESISPGADAMPAQAQGDRD